MELLQLKYFQKVAHLEHMTKAAKELSIAQPSLSKTIHLLEDELGVPLFDREGKYIKLNHNGEVFLKKVEIALSALEDGMRELKSINKSSQEQINLAFLAASPMLPGLLSAFCEKHFNVTFNLIQHLSRHSSLNFDLCISILPLNLEGVCSTPIISEVFYIAVPLRHSLASRKSIKLQEVANENFINLKKGSPFREITDSFCKLAGFSPRVAFESDDPSTVRGLIKAGQGVGFIPSVSWGKTTGSSVKLLEIEEPVCRRTIGISLFENRYHSEMVLRFREFVIDYFLHSQNIL